MPTTLITGGSRGIGAATALSLANAGHNICIVYRENAISAEEVIKEVEQRGGAGICVQANVGDVDAVTTAFTQCEQHFGPVTGLVNNAGIVGVKARLDEMDLERLTRMLHTNVLGVMLCAQAAIKQMSTRHGGTGGSIVNVSSVASRVGAPGEYVDYAASKGAVDTLTLGLAKELALEGIRVNAVRPGIIDTDIHASGGQPDRATRLAGQIPMQRSGRAAEVANSICWLLSDAASYCTGAILDVSGGR